MDPWLHEVPKSLTVRNICSPIALRCSPEDFIDVVVDHAKELLQQARTSPERPAVSRAVALLAESDSSWTVAVLDSFLKDSAWHEEFRQDRLPIESLSHEITIADCIDADSNFLSAIETWVERNPFNDSWQPLQPRVPLLVLDRNSPIGVMDEFHFCIAPVRVAVFSFLLELEEAILELAYRDAEEAIRSLSSQRIEKLKGESAGADGISLLQSTYFIDKLKIGHRQNWCFAGVSRSEFKRRSHDLNDLRNWCAHPKATFYTPWWLLKVVSEAREAMLSVQSYQ